jgi:hypothetical protein
MKMKTLTSQVRLMVNKVPSIPDRPNIAQQLYITVQFKKSTEYCFVGVQESTLHIKSILSCPDSCALM